MKIKILATGKIEECDSFYAVRLIEQGRAVPAADESGKKGGKTAGKS